jgi:hypothetical protein
VAQALPAPTLHDLVGAALEQHRDTPVAIVHARVTALISELVGAELNGHTNGATAVDVEGAGSRATSGPSTKVCRTCVRARRERERRTAATSTPAGDDAELLRTVIA